MVLCPMMPKCIPPHGTPPGIAHVGNIFSVLRRASPVASIPAVRNAALHCLWNIPVVSQPPLPAECPDRFNLHCLWNVLIIAHALRVHAFPYLQVLNLNVAAFGIMRP